MTRIPLPPAFDLRQTFTCGQCFRWQPEESPNGNALWTGIAQGRKLKICQRENALDISCSKAEFETFWAVYFDLQADYPGMQKRLAAFHPILREAIQYAPGIRILRQAPWEALCSFIISQNNHIPRIMGIIQRLCALCGEPLEGEEYAFPTAAILAGHTLESLAEIRAGFRAKYLLSAADLVSSDVIDLEGIDKNSLAYGRETLQKIMGVGPKVAECALLYGFHKTEAFPMDVWMKRAMAVLFPGMDPADFGDCAGLAQQYIFHYSRMHPELFSTQRDAGPTRFAIV